MSPRFLRGREEGFSLIEAIVALAIVAIGMSAFYRAVGASYGMQGRISALSTTVELAQSHLDGVGIVSPLAAGTWTGIYVTGFRWQLEIASIGKSSDQDRSPGSELPVTAAFWVVLRVADGRGRPVLQLETARTAGALP